MVEDYAQENINIAMLELLKHTGRDKAVWIGMWETLRHAHDSSND